MSEHKYCVDCRWHRDSLGTHYCNRRTRIDLVTGPETSTELCLIARGLVTDIHVDDPCGKEGKYWESRHKPRLWWPL